jgi:hypothetical protein
VFASFWRALVPIEKRVLIAVIALHLFAVSLPYLWALAVAPPGYEYSGLLYNPDDQNVHLSWARQSAEGHLFVRDLFTTESLQSGERPLFFNALTTLIGVLSLTGLPLVVAYHALRLVFAIIALLAIYALSTRLSDDRGVRIVALLLAAFSSGAGFLAPIFPGHIFMDRPDNPGFPMMPEAFTFASSFIFTLDIAAMALLLIVYLATLVAHGNDDSRQKKRATLIAFFAALLLSNIHTYDAIPLIIALLIWTALTGVRAHWKVSGAIVLGALLPIAYQLFVFRGSEEFRIKALTMTHAPPFFDVLLSYGLLIPLAVVGGVLGWRSINAAQRRAARLLVCWALVTLLCGYAPVSFARKMIEGLHLPLCLLAALGLVALMPRLSTTILRSAAIAGVLALCSVSSFQFVAWCLDNARDNNVSRARVLMPPLYLTTGDADALRFLQKNSEPRSSAVLCLPFLGNYVPRETGRFAYIGHWAETLHFQEKLGEAGRFYSGQMEAAEARKWLRRNRIHFVLIGAYEKQLNARLPLKLPVAFEQNGTTIYAVPF